MRRSKAKACGRVSNFTLVELLVTIVVIVILAALLLPALNAARGKAQGAGCISNLRQIGYGANMYANDWDGFLPDVYRNSDRTMEFSRVLRPYLGEACDSPYFASRSLRTILRCPGQEIPAGVTRILSGYTVTHQWFTAEGTYGCWSYDIGSVRYLSRIGKLKEKGILVSAAPLAKFEMSGDGRISPVRRAACFRQTSSMRFILWRRNGRRRRSTTMRPPAIS